MVADSSNDLDNKDIKISMYLNVQKPNLVSRDSEG